MDQELQNIVAQIITGYKPERIILFGSYAKGKSGSVSDIDLAVIKNTKENFVMRLKKIANIVRSWEAFDILVYTPQEWSDALNANHYFIKEIADTGKVIYEK